MDPNAYLKRINYSGSLAPTAESLRALHLAHLANVPFENLDIHLGNPIHIDQAGFYAKIVNRGRGGFCYELNGLFAWLLQALGFEVTFLSARVGDGKGGFSPEFDHLTLHVTCPADPASAAVPWLADVGFGECFMTPRGWISSTASRIRWDRTFTASIKRLIIWGSGKSAMARSGRSSTASR